MSWGRELGKVPRRRKTRKTQKLNRTGCLQGTEKGSIHLDDEDERAAQDLAMLVLEYLVSHEKECGFILKANGNWSVCLYSLPVCLLRSLWFYYRFK